MKHYLVLFLASFMFLASPAIATKHPKSSTSTKTPHKYKYAPAKPKWEYKSEPVRPHTDKNGHSHKFYYRHQKGMAPHY